MGTTLACASVILLIMKQVIEAAKESLNDATLSLWIVFAKRYTIIHLACTASAPAILLEEFPYE